MAEEVRVFAIAVPAGTPIVTPQTTQMAMPQRDVTEIEFRVPPGPRGEVGFRVGSAGVQIIPFAIGTWIITDDEVIHWPLTGQFDSGGWEFVAYNTGLFSHTITVRFLVDQVASRRRGSTALISPSALGAAPVTTEVPVPTLTSGGLSNTGPGAVLPPPVPPGF